MAFAQNFSYCLDQMGLSPYAFAPVLPEKGVKKAPATEGEGLDEKITRLYAKLPKLSDRQREMILGIVDEMLKNGEA